MHPLKPHEQDPEEAQVFDDRAEGASGEVDLELSAQCADAAGGSLEFEAFGDDEGVVIEDGRISDNGAVAFDTPENRRKARNAEARRSDDA